MIWNRNRAPEEGKTVIWYRSAIPGLKNGKVLLLHRLRWKVFWPNQRYWGRLSIWNSSQMWNVWRRQNENTILPDGKKKDNILILGIRYFCRKSKFMQWKRFTVTKQQDCLVRTGRSKWILFYGFGKDDDENSENGWSTGIHSTINPHFRQGTCCVHYKHGYGEKDYKRLCLERESSISFIPKTN